MILEGHKTLSQYNLHRGTYSACEPIHTFIWVPSLRGIPVNLRKNSWIVWKWNYYFIKGISRAIYALQVFINFITWYTSYSKIMKKLQHSWGKLTKGIQIYLLEQCIISPTVPFIKTKKSYCDCCWLRKWSRCIVAQCEMSWKRLEILTVYNKIASIPCAG